MNQRTKTGLEILQAAGLIGILGNLLLRETPWGLNAFLFVTVFVAGLMMLMWRRRPELLTKNIIALAGAMIFFASMFLIRDSEQLMVFDTMAILVIMGVILLVNFDIKAHVAGTFHYAVGFVWSGLTSAFGSFVLLGSDIDWKEMPGNRISKSVFAVLRGIAIALPLLLIFGALFMAADAAFEGIVNRTLRFDIDVIVSHIMLTSVLAWLTAGYFRGAIAEKFVPAAATAGVNVATGNSAKGETASFVDKVTAEPADISPSLPDNATILEHINRSDPPNAATAESATKRDWQNFDNSLLPSVFTLGTVETVIILGLIDLLFLGFVIVQVPYLFGGMEFIQQAPDFKLADYARRGFGELVAVSALVLPMLLVSHWLLRRETSLPERLFKILAGVQIALLFVIMASAVQRLLLLTGEFGYGMTTVRFYPMVVMIWLAVVFGWFALTVFRGARNHFAWGALWSAIVILGATNLMNPDAFIARTNLELASHGREYDEYYNASDLSYDAVPTLLEGLQKLPAGDACRVATYLNSRLKDPGLKDQDLRSWNLSRRNAHSQMSKNIAVAEQNGFAEPCREELPGTDSGSQ